VVKDECVAVLILENCLMADTAVDGVALELDTTRLELSASSRHVIDVQRDRPSAGRELTTDLRGIDDLDRQAPGLELAPEIIPVAGRAR
jgi:hypothetical protein